VKTFAISFNRKNLNHLLRVLYTFGARHYMGKSLEESIAHYKVDFYPHLKIFEENFISGLNASHDYPTLSYENDLSKIIDLITSNKSIKIDGVGDYTAEVFKDEVKVGCQTITAEKVKEIYNAIQTLNK